MYKSRLPLILGSTSPYRKILLQRLGIAFDTAAPDVDETPLAHEPPRALVERLSQDKARAVAIRYPQALIIGSDQVATIDGEIMGKPGNHANAVQQLSRASGNKVTFYTGLCLLNSESGVVQSSVVPFEVTFRQLSAAQIERYLHAEQPYNCAGSFKSEGLGVALFERTSGDDASALMGLPLICLTRMLENQGLELL